MDLLVIIILLSLPICLFLFSVNTYQQKKIKLPPGPQGLPFIGNLHQFDVSKPHVSFWELSKKYGPLITLKTHDLQFSSRPALVVTQKLSYNGLDLVFSPYGEYWREIRKICVIHLFNSNRAQNFRPIREDEVSRMIESISKSAAASKQVNLSEIMMSLSCNIICRLGFGKRSGDESETITERSRFHTLLNEIQALFYQELIDEHLDPKRTKAKVQQEDLVDVLLQIRKDHGFKVDLTLDHIKAVLMNIFVAGTDTSAATLVWAMTYLMKHPRVMKKVQEEIRSLVGGKKSFVDEDDVQELHYHKAVVKETMRLQPPVPLLVPKETIEKCTIDGYEIPAKTLVYVNAWAIGRDPEAWENPEEFNPERFIDRSIDFKGQNFEFIPFGAGRRICPGMHLGTANVELALANLLYKFDWEMPPGMKNQDLDFDVLAGIAVHKKNYLFLLAKAMSM
ncbi:cytochrome P450 83B1 [Citrus sinensis]|uniref:Cytochrome P450 83B1 n=2 Tax=Citrus sinensis TaxID=2711 RepID=A0ACB8JK77_CITSI|nr:cytochrome P450 83B1 [Citrus sinensis]